MIVLNAKLTDFLVRLKCNIFARKSYCFRRRFLSGRVLLLLNPELGALNCTCREFFWVTLGDTFDSV